MKIFSVALSPHDQNTYDGTLHRQMERYTRLKHNVPRHVDVYPHHSELVAMDQENNNQMVAFYDEVWKPEEHEIFAFTTTIGGMKLLPPNHDVPLKLLDFKPENLWDYMLQDNLYYIDHHQSHAAYAYLTSGFKESDILAIDGRGWHYNCIFIDKNGKITDLSNSMWMGVLWNYCAKMVGFGHLGAGKLMGLAAYGNSLDYLEMWFANFFDTSEIPDKMNNLFSVYRPEDIAASLQQATIDRINDLVIPLKTCDNICVAGGVAYNGYMNEELAKHYKGVHVPPAPGDEGQSLGTYMHADYTLNKNIHQISVYSGDEYVYNGTEKVDLKEVAQAIANGSIVGWYQGKSESGNRALGNRSILADPREPHIKDMINELIKQREDFRPFAPTVLEEHYQEYFDTTQPSPYMSRIMPVKSDKIPGVTHIDGTARIQTLTREQNPRYYDLINEFYKITGIPMLLNTSFNCKEPIVETPDDAIATFKRTELDLLVINDYIVRKMG